jgi:hypothetical protein
VFDPKFAEEPDHSPAWQRVLLATALPLLVAWLGGSACLHFLGRSEGGSAPAVGADWHAIFHNAAIYLSLTITAPFVLVLVGTAWTVKWKSWQTALGGGLLRLLMAIACGAVVLALLSLLG